jgi:hypothetical protein
MATKEDLDYTGSLIKNYLKYMKKKFIEEGMLASTANIFPDIHHCCFQLERGSADPVPYSDEKFLWKFQMWMNIVKTKNSHLLNDIRDDVLEYQQMFKQYKPS